MKKIYVAGHNGMVGSALIRLLKAEGHCAIITASRQELDLLDQNAVRRFFAKNRIDQVYLAAAHVGGIVANANFPAEFIYNNLTLQNNVIHGAYLAGVDRLLFLGSSCIYPKYSAQPMREECLLTGELEKTNEPYAIAKIAGLNVCSSYRQQYGCDFRSLMPTNLYGPNDNFHLENSHVIPGLLSRFHSAVNGNTKKIEIWGTGKARREFLHVDDLASACCFAMSLEKKEWITATRDSGNMLNVGTGVDCTILRLAEIIADVTKFNGRIDFDMSKPDGTPRKLLDSSRISNVGWDPKIELDEGLRSLYAWYKDNLDEIRC